MNRFLRTTAAAAIGLGFLVAARGARAEEQPSAFFLGGRHASQKIHVAVVTGGHPYNHEEFMKLFEGYPDVSFEHRPQATGGELFEQIDKQNWPYDVVVLYNFNQKITPQQQENLVWLLDKGMGLVILHHANDAYPDWPTYHDISGVESHFGKWQQNGVEMAPSGFTGGIHFKVHIADPNHPITRGMSDYDAVDETYCRRTFSPDNHLLLSTDEATSDKPLCWARNFHGKARVVYLQSGHDQQMYQNPTYRELVVRALRWTAGRLD